MGRLRTLAETRRATRKTWRLTYANTPHGSDVSEEYPTLKAAREAAATLGNGRPWMTYQDVVITRRDELDGCVNEYHVEYAGPAR